MIKSGASIFIILFLVACSNQNSRNLSTATDTVAAVEQNDRGANAGATICSLSSIIQNIDMEGIKISRDCYPLLNVESQSEGFMSLMGSQPIGDNGHLLVIGEKRGCTVTTCQDRIVLKYAQNGNEISSSEFVFNYETDLKYSFLHQTFFLAQCKVNDWGEDDLGNMFLTGKPATTTWECRAVLNNKISSLQELNKADLLICRNLIFARYGYIFKLDSLREYFSKSDWYKPTSANVNDKLTEEDKAIISLILKEEALKK